jgi:endonuclease/exonuclease/phosphatase family metal-dependent hydrolase
VQLIRSAEEINEPLIICGDFNGEPSESLYQIMGDNGFANAYFNLSRSNKEPQFTTYKYRDHLESKCIDYIWCR